MVEQLLDQIRSQIPERVRALEPAAREGGRLEAALAALGDVGSGGTPASAAAASPARRSRWETTRRASAKRAPRGANREAVLRVLGERPGVPVSELSGASGVARAVLYSLLKTLEERGEVVKEPLPGGTSGYRLASFGSESNGPGLAASPADDSASRDGPACSMWSFRGVVATP